MLNCFVTNHPKTWWTWNNHLILSIVLWVRTSGRAQLICLFLIHVTSRRVVPGVPESTPEPASPLAARLCLIGPRPLSVSTWHHILQRLCLNLGFSHCGFPRVGTFLHGSWLARRRKQKMLGPLNWHSLTSAVFYCSKQLQDSPRSTAGERDSTSWRGNGKATLQRSMWDVSLLNWLSMYMVTSEL